MSAGDGDAWHQGWNVAGSDGSQHPRPFGLTSTEREAYDDGWETRADRIRMGYDLPHGWPQPAVLE